MITLNLTNIADPRVYLYKQKLWALSLDPEATYDKIILIVPSGLSYELAHDITNLELVKLIEDLIDATYDAMTTWAEQKNIYQNHLPPS